jgi:hypothetical protein
MATHQTWKLRPSGTRPGWHSLIGPYNQGFVEALKDTVASCDRDYNSDAKIWYIRDGAVEDVQKVIADWTIKPPAPPAVGAEAAAELLAVLPRVGAPFTIGDLGDVFAMGVEDIEHARVIQSATHAFVQDGKTRYVFVGIIEIEK